MLIFVDGILDKSEKRRGLEHEAEMWIQSLLGFQSSVNIVDNTDIYFTIVSCNL
uniref:Uncharacterized protein n=1 Tax=Manihot esculenta TaxID=3983 RepID=A0A2C9W8B5_MANES